MRYCTTAPAFRLRSASLAACSMLRKLGCGGYCLRIARENQAARAADAAACIDTSVGTALLKNGWCLRWDDSDGCEKFYIDEH